MCAINHLEETLAKLEDFVRSDVFKKSVGLFSIFKVRGFVAIGFGFSVAVGVTVPHGYGFLILCGFGGPGPPLGFPILCGYDGPSAP